MGGMTVWTNLDIQVVEVDYYMSWFSDLLKPFKDTYFAETNGKTTVYGGSVGEYYTDIDYPLAVYKVSLI